MRISYWSVYVCSSDLVDEAVVEDRRGERQGDAEILEFDGNRALAAACLLSHRNRELTACQEAGGVAREGDEVGLRQSLHDALFLKRDKQEVAGHRTTDRKSVVKGKRVTVRVTL